MADERRWFVRNFGGSWWASVRYGARQYRYHRYMVRTHREGAPDAIDREREQERRGERGDA